MPVDVREQCSAQGLGLVEVGDREQAGECSDVATGRNIAHFVLVIVNIDWANVGK
ncbi:MAG: hypothetical protein V7733_15500 [Paraglaciecola polaris]|uniref:hypothetical protein n=1 Tax=Paraglaciecola polaris TaxID=222814 RepID=UPI0030039602